MDISADLTELGRTPVAVVCAGAKSVSMHGTAARLQRLLPTLLNSLAHSNCS
jgi:pseudouridine-5'-phosphate glycosidase